MTIRLKRELAEWLEQAAARAGVSQGRIIRDQLEGAMSRERTQPFMRLAGALRGPRDLSRRKGFSKR